MSQSLTAHLHSTLLETPIRAHRSKSPFQLRFILTIIFILLVLSLFFLDFEVMEMSWSPQQRYSIQSVYQKLSTYESLTTLTSSSKILPQNNLLTNESEFNELLSYYSKVSATYPQSWIHLNEQLFCPIRYSQSLHSTNSISNAGERLLKLIYQTQFVSNCNDPKHKFVIFNIAQMAGTGIGAIFNGGILKYFVRAMMSKRIFLINGEFGWSAHAPYCSQYIGMECYFLPLSNCNPDELLEKTDKKNIWSGGVPSHCTLGDSNDKSLKFCTERIIYSVDKSSGWTPKNGDINEWIHSHLIYNNQSIFGNFVEFKSVLQSFVFRLNKVVRNIVMNKVRDAFIESMNQTYNFDPFQSISFPIRASDKCHQNKLGLNGEMECWTREELFLLLQSIHTLNKNINTVIFTSEDFDFVDKLIQCIKYQINCENKTQINILNNYLNFKWNIIINHLDTKPSIGNANFRIFHKNKDEKFQFQNDIGIDLEHDVVVGAFSSMMLQMNSKYVIHTKSSSWLDNVWSMASSLFCESILWSKQLQLNGFNNMINDIESLEQIEFNRLKNEYERPMFLPQLNKKYQFFNRYCFELKQFGTLNKKTKWKHILFPPDLWDKIHAHNLSPELFYSLFGIQIYENGWNNYCKRYTKLPFETDVDYGV